MAEKRVSVRLAAVGGKQVRAELEGVGETGSRGFGRLSREMEAANARLGSFARKAGIALAAVTTAAAAAGVAMVRSGLDTIGAQADMAASLRTTVESLQVLTWAGELAGVSMGEIEQATKKLTTRLSEAAAGSGSAVGALQRLNLTAAELQALPLDQRIVAIQDALARYVPEAERAAVASDLFGDRAALAFLRIDSATLREAAQDVQDFGVAVSAADAVQIERTGDAIAKLSLIWLGLTNRLTAAVAPALEAVANALADMARGTGPVGSAVTALFDNLGRLTAYAATFAAFLAGRWVAGMAAAALSVRGLATALVLLRGALIRTGIGALIVGAGELIYQFTQLSQGAGGFGNAMALLGDVASEVWDRIKLGGQSLSFALQSVWTSIRAGWLSALESIQKTWADFLHAVARGLDGIPGMESTMLGVYGAAVSAGSAFYETAGAAAEASAEADRLAASARAAANAAIAPLSSIEALRQALSRASEPDSSALTDATDAAERFESALGDAGRAATEAGAAAGTAAAAAKPDTEGAMTGWQAVTAALSDYASKAREIGGDIGQSLVSAFQSAENAVGEFVKTGKLNFGDLVTSLIGDLAKLAARRFILGPIANALGGILGQAGGVFANILHAGGMVGSAGPSRMVPAMAFAAAPRMHAGGSVGLRHDEVPAILQRGERVLSRREAQSYGAGGVNVTIMARDAESFRQSRTQVAADIARAVSLGRRGL